MPKPKAGLVPAFKREMLMAVKGAASIRIPADMLEKYAQLGYTVYPAERSAANDKRGTAAEDEDAIAQ